MADDRGYTVATMDTLGYICEQPRLAMDRHLTYWFAARKNQSRVLDNVKSFEYILHQYQGDKDSLVSGVKHGLEVHFGDLFGNVDVQVTPINITQGGGQFNLGIAVNINYNGENYDLAAAVLISGSSYTLVNNGRVNNG